MFKFIGRSGRKNVLEDAPSSYDNPIYFESTLSGHISRCSKCPTNGRCANSQKLFDSEVLLLINVDSDAMHNIFKSLSLLPVADFKECLRMSGFVPEFQILNRKRLRYLEKRFKININIYKREDSITVAVREPLNLDFDKTVNIMALEPLPETMNGEINNFAIINDSKLLPKLLECSITPGCRYSTYKTSDFNKHQKICGKSNVQIIKCKQVTYGDNRSVLQEMVKKEIVPPEALLFRNNKMATWDIETLEVPIEGCNPKHGLITKANLNLLSIALASNLPGHRAKCWVCKLSAEIVILY